MSSIKMSDVFKLPVSCEEVAEIGVELFDNSEDAYAALAINNHDRLVEEIDQLKSILKKVQTELGEQDFKIVKLKEEASELREKLVKCLDMLEYAHITNESYYDHKLVRDFIEDIYKYLEVK